MVPFVLGVFSSREHHVRPLSLPVSHFDVACTMMAWLNIDFDGATLDCTVQGV